MAQFMLYYVISFWFWVLHSLSVLKMKKGDRKNRSQMASANVFVNYSNCLNVIEIKTETLHHKHGRFHDFFISFSFHSILESKTFRNSEFINNIITQSMHNSQVSTWTNIEFITISIKFFPIFIFASATHEHHSVA